MPLANELRPAIDWQEIRDLLNRHPERDTRCEVACWALSTLQEQLGDSWLKRATAMGDGDFPLGLHLLSGHNHALAEALEWALRLELCRDWDGSADFLRDLVNDPRPSRILHSRSQLAQASFAERLGWPVALEPSSDLGTPADLLFITPVGPVTTEIRVLVQSDFGRSQRETAQRNTDWLFWLGLEHGVWIGGELARDPGEDERHEIEAFVRKSAEVQPGGRPRFERPGIFLELAGRDSSGPPLTSPLGDEELFGRMARVIGDKAHKMAASGAQWLHVTVLSGLWSFTAWGRAPLDHKLSTMSASLLDALGDRRPAGVILTSAASLAPEDMQEEIVRGDSGIALRSRAQPVRARESLILPLLEEAQPSAEHWLALARAESGWLDWALERRGLPRLGDLIPGCLTSCPDVDQS